MPGDALSEALADAARRLAEVSSMDETLATIVHAAQASIPAADHVGVTAAHPDGRFETLAATDDRVRELDDLQHRLGEGPCVSAIEGDRTVHLPDVAADSRWPGFLAEAGRLGLRSQIGIPLRSDRSVRTGLNIYSGRRLDAHSVQVADLFAAQAAIALRKAMVIDQLQEGMRTRQRIGVAVGILMQKYEMTEERAFAYLLRASSQDNIKLRDVAARIVSDLTRDLPG